MRTYKLAKINLMFDALLALRRLAELAEDVVVTWAYDSGFLTLILQAGSYRIARSFAIDELTDISDDTINFIFNDMLSSLRESLSRGNNEQI